MAYMQKVQEFSQGHKTATKDDQNLLFVYTGCCCEIEIWAP